MSNFPTMIAGIAAATALFASAPAWATNYSLWIHGRDQSTQPGNYNDWNSWGPSSANAGVNKRAVNWDGKSHISDQNYLIRNALDCFCTGSNWCYVAVHSAGDLQIGYALDLYGGSTRNIKNAAPNASGVCGDAGGTQAGWNIKWVDVASGAGGGSELANLGYWAVSDALTSDLRTGTARALYNHNTTRSHWLYMFAGAKGTVYSGVLDGQDDDAVAYHSTGGMSATGAFCNPGDLFCDDTLNLGTAGSTKGGSSVAKWSYHTVSLRDDSEQYSHSAGGTWGGIVGTVRQDMQTHAL